MKYCKQCNAEITHKYKRRLCMDCIRKENRDNYNFKHDVYYAARNAKKLHKVTPNKSF